MASSTIRFSTDASRDITGLAGGADGRIAILCNVGAFDAVLKDESGSSTAANRFDLGADITIPAQGNVILRYDATLSRWLCVGAWPGTSSGGITQLTGDVTAGPGSGSQAATIAAGAVTLAMMANLAQDQFIVRTTASTGVPETATVTAAARTVLDDTTVGAMLTTLGGQPLDATLTAFAALTIAANSLTIGTGADAFSQTTFAANTFPARASTGDLAAKSITDFGLSLIDDAAASNARTTLGATTVGGNLFTLANPSAVTFPRINIDNTVDALSASVFRTAIGATEVGSHLFTVTDPSAIRFLRINIDNTVDALSASAFRTAIGADYTSSNLRGAFAGAPAAGTGGRTYRCTDSKFFGYDTGSVWKWSWDSVEIADLATAATWTQANAASATYTTTYGGTIIAAAAQASLHRLGAMYTAAPSAPYSNGVRIGVQFSAIGNYYGWSGCGWSDGTKYLLWMFIVADGTIPQFIRVGWDTTSTYAGYAAPLNFSAYGNFLPSSAVYYRLVDDNTNLIVSLSFDGGRQWFQVDSQARTGYLSAPTYLACGIDPYNRATSAHFFDKTDL